MRIHLIKVVKHESEEERYIMTWKNSICTENHHYVVHGKFYWNDDNRVEFTSHIYPRNPGIIYTY